MYCIKINRDVEEALDILEQTIIHVPSSLSRGFGFVGKVDRESKSFWIIDRMNMYRSRKGLKLHAYRRFEAFIYKKSCHTVIEGEFRLLPIYKISIGLYYSWLMLMLLMVIFFSNDIFTIVKTISLAFLMGLAGIGVVHFNLERSKQYEEETINFIKGLFQ